VAEAGSEEVARQEMPFAVGNEVCPKSHIAVPETLLVVVHVLAVRDHPKTPFSRDRDFELPMSATTSVPPELT
jgi:hypothetical protein